MKGLRPFALLLLTALPAAACDGASTKARSPHWGKDTCQICRMAVTEKPPAAQLLGPGVQVRYFDDLGCAVNAILTNATPPAAELYVVSPGTEEEWIQASQTRFRADMKTPMNYGYLPAAKGALTIDEVVDQIREKHAQEWRVPEPN